jgi:recombination protein RecT
MASNKISGNSVIDKNASEVDAIKREIIKSESDTRQPRKASELNISELMHNKATQKHIEGLLRGKSSQFIASVLSLAQDSNNRLGDVAPFSILTACLTAAALDLPINNGLGFAYIIPYGKKAQFQMGWRGFFRLAMRTGQYEDIGARIVYEGELVGADAWSGEPEFDFSIDREAKGRRPIGAMAYLVMKNGFKKRLFMTIEELERHAQKYSKSYSRLDSVWKTNFEAMAKKTVLKLLLGRYGVMSFQLETALVSDQSADRKYVDNESTSVDLSVSEVKTDDGNGISSPKPIVDGELVEDNYGEPVTMAEMQATLDAIE